MKTTEQAAARIENYSLAAGNGRHIRTATKIVLKDGSEIRFTEKMSKRLALAQLASQPSRSRCALTPLTTAFKASEFTFSAYPFVA